MQTDKPIYKPGAEGESEFPPLLYYSF
jgi:hypothetical protein